MRKFLTALVIVAATSMVAQAQVTGSVNADNKIVVTGTGQMAAGLDFISAGGNLVPIADNSAAPWTFLLANTANQITYGSLGTSVTLDGDTTLVAGYTGPGGDDLVGFWGNGPTPEPIEFAADEPDPPVVVPPVVDPPAADGLVGEIRDGVIWIVGTGQKASGLDFQSAAGNLVPVPDPKPNGEAGNLPFTFFLSNTANQITWGNLGTTVTIDGELNTFAGYTGDPAGGDLQTFWGDGPNPVAFAVAAGAVDPPVVDPPVVDPPVVDPPVVDPPVVEPPGNEVIPEPTSGLLAVFAALGVLGFRKRRS